MRIKQLGNGGAFNFDQTNSSFIIESFNNTILFDCGYNVFSKLRELNYTSKIDTVFISHMDDDHIGSLKSLIYYRYFIDKKKTSILCGEEVYPLLVSYLEDVNYIIDNGYKVQEDICEVFKISDREYCYITYDFCIGTIKGNHGKPSYGIKCYEKNKKQFMSCILISGDTKANINFYRELKNIDSKYLAFHDYSNWNEESKQVHACAEDFNLFYRDYKDKIIKYHTGEDFNKDWIEI